LARSTLLWGRPVRRGLLTTLCTTLVLILFSALVFHFTPISEALLPVTSLGILVVSAFIGGLVGAREAGIRGLFHGLVIGVIFFVLIAALAFIVAPEAFAVMHIVKKLLACVIPGACGGMIGVSMS